MDRHRPVASCSATAASSARNDGASSPAATSPRRRMGRESSQAGGDRAGLNGGRRSHDTAVGIHHSGVLFFKKKPWKKQQF